MKFGLAEEELSLIRSTLALYPMITEVRIFGSRAMGTQRPNSDIDLVLYGDMTECELGRIHHALDELPLPYQFDLHHAPSIEHEGLRHHITQWGAKIWP